MNLSGEPKRDGNRPREIMPADGSNPAQRERGFRHVPAFRRATLKRVGSLSLVDGRGKA
jgi:hypothetical protein